MSACILTFLVFAAGLFLCKVLYLFATAGALPMTQGAVFTSTAGVRIRSFLDAVPMNGNELLVDLGCGDGRVLRAAQRRYGVRALGFEVNALAYCLARVLSFPMKGVQIRCKNFWSENLQDADVVLIMNSHKSHRGLAVGKLAQKSKKPLIFIDCWNLYDKKKIQSLGNIIYSSVGLY